MADFLERLRNIAIDQCSPDIKRAADEIERLQADLATATDILSEARSNHVAGSSADAVWDVRRDRFLAEHRPSIKRRVTR